MEMYKILASVVRDAQIGDRRHGAVDRREQPRPWDTDRRRYTIDLENEMVVELEIGRLQDEMDWLAAQKGKMGSAK